MLIRCGLEISACCLFPRVWKHMLSICSLSVLEFPTLGLAARRLLFTEDLSNDLVMLSVQVVNSHPFFALAIHTCPNKIGAVFSEKCRNAGQTCCPSDICTSQGTICCGTQ